MSLKVETIHSTVPFTANTAGVTQGKANELKLSVFGEKSLSLSCGYGGSIPNFSRGKAVEVGILTRCFQAPRRRLHVRAEMWPMGLDL